MLIIKKKKKRKENHLKEIELPNQEKIRSLKGEEMYKYLEILEVNTIKQIKMKEKIRSTSEQEKFSKTNSTAEI